MPNNFQAGMPNFKSSDDLRCILPKIVIVGTPATNDEHLSARYFTPRTYQRSYTVRGAVCTDVLAALPDSVVSDVVRRHSGAFASFVTEHPFGFNTASLDASIGKREGELDVRFGGCASTARRIMDCHAYLSRSIWDGSL